MTERIISLLGLEQMLKSYSSNSAFLDTESQRITAALMDEVNICRFHLPRFNDERVIFRMLVFGAHLTSLCLSFLMTYNILGRELL